MENNNTMNKKGEEPMTTGRLISEYAKVHGIEIPRHQVVNPESAHLFDEHNKWLAQERRAGMVEALNQIRENR